MIDIVLTEDAFEQLNDSYPPGGNNKIISGRAIELVKAHFETLHPGCGITKLSQGADLRVEWGTERLEIEVKGTAKGDIAWQQLKVSSRASHDLLKDGLPLYRVMAVFARVPKLFVLTHGVDFTMKREPRWQIVRVRD